MRFRCAFYESPGSLRADPAVIFAAPGPRTSSWMGCATARSLPLVNSGPPVWARLGHNRPREIPEGRLTAVGGAARLEDPQRAALFARIAAGDSAALGTLYDETSGIVFGLCSRILGDPADAEEVTLDVYTQVWRQAARYDPERGEPVTWLLTLAHSRAIDRLRSRAPSRKREQGLDSAPGVADLPGPGADPEAASAFAERARFVRQALASLSAEQREVLELAYFEGLTHVEIAGRIRQPLGTTKSRIRLGLGKLREALAPFSRGWPA